MTRIRQYEMTAAEWTSQNPVLLKGEVGWETPTTGQPAKAKKGDGVTAWTGLAYSVQPSAPLASPAFTGNPTAPTPVASDNDTSVATTSFVQTVIAPKAPLASPVFTGNPTAPTPTAGDNDTSVATTQFVQTAIAPKAPLASPAFTGNPTAPTPAAGDNDTSVATTSFVKTATDALKGGATGVLATRERQTTQSIPNAVDTVVSFPTVVTESGLTWDVINSWWTITVAGRYQINAGVHFEQNGAGYRRSRLIRRRAGSDRVFILDQKSSNAAFGTSAVGGIALLLAVGDTIKITAEQNSGGALNVYGDSGSGATYFSAVYVGP